MFSKDKSKWLFGGVFVCLVALALVWMSRENPAAAAVERAEQLLEAAAEPELSGQQVEDLVEEAENSAQDALELLNGSGSDELQARDQSVREAGLLVSSVAYVGSKMQELDDLRLEIDTLPAGMCGAGASSSCGLGFHFRRS